MRKKTLKNSLEVKNKVIIVTGASGEIGLSICNHLILTGSKVIAISRSSRPKKLSNEVNYIKLDINNINEIKTIIKKIFNNYKKISALVNLAGISIKNTANLDNFEATLKTNLISTFNLTNSVAYYMKMKKKGTIINVSSIGAHMGFKSNPGYVASKGGLNSLTKSQAFDLGRYNIRVNNLVPGYIKSSMTFKSFSNPRLSKNRINRNIIPRWGKPEDLIGAIIFLISDSSSYVTGSDLIVDGGFLSKGI